MRRLLLVCVLFGLFAVGCNTAPNSVTESANKSVATASPSATTTPAGKPANASNGNTSANTESDITGAYFVKGTLPSDFSEIEHLSLATIDDQGNTAPLNGFIRPKRRSAQDYKLVSPELNGKNLTFSTTTVNGVSYSFTGTFEKLDNFPANPPSSDEVILRGKLTKMLDGSTVIESDVSFTYSAGG